MVGRLVVRKVENLLPIVISGSCGKADSEKSAECRFVYSLEDAKPDNCRPQRRAWKFKN